MPPYTFGYQVQPELGFRCIFMTNASIHVDTFVSGYQIPRPVMQPPAVLQPPPAYNQVSQETKDMLFPPEYNSIIGVNNAGGYPPLSPSQLPPILAPPVEYNHDFRSPGGLRAPQINIGLDDGTADASIFELWRCGVHVEANYSTAFVTMSLVFRAPANATKHDLGAAVFQLPQSPSATVSECRMTVGTNGPAPRPFAVTVLSTSDAEKLAGQHRGDAATDSAAPSMVR